MKELYNKIKETVETNKKEAIKGNLCCFEGIATGFVDETYHVGDRIFVELTEDNKLILDIAEGNKVKRRLMICEDKEDENYPLKCDCTSTTCWLKKEDISVSNGIIRIDSVGCNLNVENK